MTRKTKRLLWAGAFVILAAVLIFTNLPKKKTAAPGTKPGELLPEFTVTCLDGSSFSLQEQHGKVVVINLWATWCAPCVKELPNFERLQQEYPRDVAILALHSPPVTTDVTDYLADYSYSIPFAVDENGSLTEMLNASTVLPQTVIIDPGGIVIYNQSGALSYDRLLELVAAAKTHT